LTGFRGIGTLLPLGRERSDLANTTPVKSRALPSSGLARSEDHYGRLFRRTLGQHLVLYLVPLALLAGYFLIQYRTLLIDSSRANLRVLAESQALTLDVFLWERVANLSNLVDDADLLSSLSDETAARSLQTLQGNSVAFAELAFFDGKGHPLAYAGPFRALETRDYGGQQWFVSLRDGTAPFIITDSYLGFREQPHFAIAVKRKRNEGDVIARAVIFPGQIQEYLSSIKHAQDTRTAVVDARGRYQVAPPTEGELLASSPFAPPPEEPFGNLTVELDGRTVTCGFAWLQTTGWALVVHESADAKSGGGLPAHLVWLTGLFVVVGGLAIWLRTRAVVRHRRETDETEASLSGQLVHAAKLASVGELAAGIAHEINNPLAIIAEEVGLIQDLLSPEFANQMAPERLERHLANIHDATFRCRDITRKLLGFVRQDEVKLEYHDIRQILDGVVDGLLGSSISVTNVEVVKEYAEELPEVLTDRGQIEQVLLNLVKNALDAMEPEGRLTLEVSGTAETVGVSVMDTGVGMEPEQVERVFQPFYTTKEVGKGTGLGLAVSLGIVKNLGGNMFVQSRPGKGSRFVVELPARPD
jgi:two-component system NtrC family sensor kinase